MTRRSRARQVALQLLFQFDLNPKVSRVGIEKFVHDRLNDPDSEPFTLLLYDTVIARRREIDRQLSQAAENWKLHRMAAVDRNVLRLGLCEATFLDEKTPRTVALDEAIELARQFGSADSPSFINGVLDKATPHEES